MENVYFEISISVKEQPVKDMLIAELSAAGYDGFEEEREAIKAFVPASEFDEKILGEIIMRHSVSFDKTTIENRNWNAEWEAGFQPVRVNDYCVIRADFHPAASGIKHDIIITPKMSFGTGHHATTYLMIDTMSLIDFTNKYVFDYGTGTGILAILAEKEGAKDVVATDNDEWSIANATENFNRNNCRNILLINTEEIPGVGKYNIILANINRNVLLQSMAGLQQHLSEEGVLILSGLLADDAQIIVNEAKKHRLVLAEQKERNGWICLRMVNE
jgi:ribosomal protein L11 methyltransferase